jgi:hypothetical protein
MYVSVYRTIITWNRRTAYNITYEANTTYIHIVRRLIPYELGAAAHAKLDAHFKPLCVRLSQSGRPGHLGPRAARAASPGGPRPGANGACSASNRLELSVRRHNTVQSKSRGGAAGAGATWTTTRYKYRRVSLQSRFTFSRHWTR